MAKMHILVSLLLGLAILTACQPSETNLPFETIERADSAGTGEYHKDKEPDLAIIAKAADISVLGNMVSSDAQARLRDLDFDRYFAIAVFQGWRPSLPTPRSGVEVQRITKEGSRITIYAQFYEPVEGYEQKTVVTSPYHLVKMRKGEDM